MEEVNYVYVIEKWMTTQREWLPIHVGTADLKKMGEFLQTLECTLPEDELRLAQYTLREEKIIHSYS